VGWCGAADEWEGGADINMKVFQITKAALIYTDVIYPIPCLVLWRDIQKACFGNHNGIFANAESTRSVCKFFNP
jgi:hypothetical protein